MSIIIWETPVPSTTFQGVFFYEQNRRICSIEYSYETEKVYTIMLEKLYFHGVESFKCTYYSSCSPEMTEACDKLVEVENSEWLSEIKQRLSENDNGTEKLKHLRINFYGGPCYEFVCESIDFSSMETMKYIY